MSNTYKVEVICAATGEVVKTLEAAFSPAQPAAQQGVAYAELPDERAAFEAWYIARAIEAEVRKQDTELIRQLVEALENSNATLWEEDDDPSRPAHAAITAARARLEVMP